MTLVLLIIYIKLIAAAFVGLGIRLWEKNETMRKLSGKSNIEYPGFWGFVKQDQALIIGTVLTLSLFFLTIGGAINPEHMKLADDPICYLDGWICISRRMIYEAILVTVCSTLGYVGINFALKWFSVTNRKMVDAIDYKTTLADQATGNLQKPTPVE